MKLIKVGAAVLNQTPLDWSRNLENCREAIETARAAGVSILCLPELCLTGYGAEDAFHSPDVLETALEMLHALLPHTGQMVVSAGLPLLHRQAVFNTACLIADGAILGFVGKNSLAGDGIHYEPRWFRPWPSKVVGRVRVGERDYPIGDLVFDVGGVRIGFEICEDAWVADRPGIGLSRLGVDLILNPSASHFAFGKLEVRKRFVLEGSRAFGLGYVYANLLGNESGRAIYDGGALIASNGALLAVGPRFSYRKVHVTSAVLDIETTRTLKAQKASFRPDLSEATVVEVAFRYPEREPELAPPVPASFENSPHLKEEEFTRAIALGLFDYLVKSHSNGFVVSLSGGADSAAVASLVALGAWLGANELGLPEFAARLGLKTAPEDVPALIRSLLCCAYQATKNSGAVTHDAALSVAQALGAEFFDLDVEPLVQGYTALIERAIGRTLSWERDDITLQNVQARVRAPSVWMLANLKNALLLATSNRSEAAVGYATMDGDTAGGLSPIAGIDKAFLRRWLVWLEREGPVGARNYPALAAINRQAPTAELRPPAAAQTDERDLMPYPLLDAIEDCAIGEKLGPRSVYRRMRAAFPDLNRLELAEYVERFFRLWCRNQWKRERYAPSFHVDDKNLDPRTWCRFPILSGGYERELHSLRAWVERG